MRTHSLALGAAVALLTTAPATAAEPTSAGVRELTAFRELIRVPRAEAYASEIGTTRVVVIVEGAQPLPQFELQVGATKTLRMFDKVDPNIGVATGLGYGIGYAGAGGLMAGPVALLALGSGFMIDSDIEKRMEEASSRARATMAPALARMPTAGIADALIAELRAAAAAPAWLRDAEFVVGSRPFDVKAFDGESLLVIDCLPYVPVERDRVALRIIATHHHRRLGPAWALYARKGQRYASHWFAVPLARNVGEGDVVLLDEPAKDATARTALQEFAGRAFPIDGLVGARYNERVNARLKFERDIRRTEWTTQQLGIVNATRLNALEDAALTGALAGAVRPAVADLLADVAQTMPKDEAKPRVVIKPHGLEFDTKLEPKRAR